MAHPLAGAYVDRGVKVEIRWKHRKQRGLVGVAMHALFAFFFLTGVIALWLVQSPNSDPSMWIEHGKNRAKKSKPTELAVDLKRYNSVRSNKWLG